MWKGLAVALVVIAHSARAQSLPTFVTSPILTIDDSIGDTTRMSSRLTDAKRLSDGRIVGAVCGANELRSFDNSGRKLGTLVIPNSPRPQRLLWRLMPAGGDTLAAYMGVNSGLTLIDPSFKVLRAVAIPNPDTTTFQGRPRASRLDVIGRFPDGTYVGRLIASGPPAPGLSRRTMSLYHFDESGRVLDSTSFPGPEVFAVAGQPMTQSLRLARTTVLALSGDRVIVGDQTGHFLAEYSASLAPQRRIATLTHPLATTDSIRQAWTRAAIDRAMMPTNGVLAVFGSTYADSTPAFRDLVAGNDGRVWVQDPLGADHYPLIWTGYQNGKAVARAELPPRFYPTQFGSDWVLGLAYDTTKTDRLQLLKLTAGPLRNARLSARDAAPANRPGCGAFISR